MNIGKKGKAGINTFTCPTCKGGGMKGVLFVKMGMRDYAKMRAYGSVKKTVTCNNENHSHQVDVVLERPKGSACIIKGDND